MEILEELGISGVLQQVWAGWVLVTRALAQGLLLFL